MALSYDAWLGMPDDDRDYERMERQQERTWDEIAAWMDSETTEQIALTWDKVVSDMQAWDNLNQELIRAALDGRDARQIVRLAMIEQFANNYSDWLKVAK